MPFNGSGAFQPLAPPDFPAISGQPILASAFNNVLNDVNTGLSSVVTRNGESPATANLPMGGFKHTGVADGVSATDYASYGQLLAYKGSQIPSAADYGAAGVSPSADTAAINAGIAAIHAGGGGMLRINRFISQTIDLNSLTNQTDVQLLDERYLPSGQWSFFTTGTDSEFRVSGTSTSSGEGPSVVLVNNATTGNRTVSLVGRYGPGIGSNVNQVLHFGVWDGTNWFAELDWLGIDGGGLRSKMRVGAQGTFQLNATQSGAAAYTAGEYFAINRPFLDGGGRCLTVKSGATILNGELQIAAANGPIRMQNAAGANRFSFLVDFPSTGQWTLYDNILGRAVLTATSGGQIASTGPLSLTPVAAGSVVNNNLFVDSADNKLKYKGLSGTVTALANP